MQNTPSSTQLFDERQTAQALGVSRDFLKKDRRGARVIPFYRIGAPGTRGAIRYDMVRVQQALKAVESGGPAK